MNYVECLRFLVVNLTAAKECDKPSSWRRKRVRMAAAVAERLGLHAGRGSAENAANGKYTGRVNSIEMSSKYKRKESA